jgi:hypothetical protein
MEWQLLLQRENGMRNKLFCYLAKFFFGNSNSAAAAAAAKKKKKNKKKARS